MESITQEIQQGDKFGKAITITPRFILDLANPVQNIPWRVTPIEVHLIQDTLDTYELNGKAFLVEIPRGCPFNLNKFQKG